MTNELWTSCQSLTEDSFVHVCSLTQQEQVLAQSQGGWLSPGEVRVGGGGKGEAKGVDIIQMLTKARTEYDKVCAHCRILKRIKQLEQHRLKCWE